MSLYLDTRGNSVVSVACCDRCKCKRPIGMLIPDGNTPALRVCSDKPGCWDNMDPWRLPARSPDKITIQYPRPDTPLVVGPNPDPIVPPD